MIIIKPEMISDQKRTCFKFICTKYYSSKIYDTNIILLKIKSYYYLLI